MRGKAALIGFLVVQAAVIAIWITHLAPLATGGTPFTSDSIQVWSGAIFSDVTTNFRARSSALTSTPFSPTGPLLWSCLLIAASGVSAYLASRFFHRERVWLAAGLAGLALVLGAGAAFFIVEQFAGDTSFSPGAVAPVWLYMITRAFLIQLIIGFAFLAIGTVLAIAGVSTPARPLGFHLVALNWLIVSGVWIAVYLGLFVLPSLNAAS
jgi:heme/copper-type cytochrome/quinol oxidase subunit 3